MRPDIIEPGPELGWRGCWASATGVAAVSDTIVAKITSFDFAFMVHVLSYEALIVAKLVSSPA
jgi:hypothetical protein